MFCKVLFFLHTCMAYSALPRRLNSKPQGLKLDIHMMSMALKLLAKVWKTKKIRWMFCSFFNLALRHFFHRNQTSKKILLILFWFGFGGNIIWMFHEKCFAIQWKQFKSYWLTGIKIPEQGKMSDDYWVIYAAKFKKGKVKGKIKYIGPTSEFVVSALKKVFCISWYLCVLLFDILYSYFPLHTFYTLFFNDLSYIFFYS